MIQMTIQIGLTNILFKSMILQLYEKPKGIIEEKYNTNAKQFNINLNSKKVRMAGNVTIYKYKNILKAQ